MLIQNGAIVSVAAYLLFPLFHINLPGKLPRGRPFQAENLPLGQAFGRQAGANQHDGFESAFRRCQCRRNCVNREDAWRVEVEQAEGSEIGNEMT
jgi:hypothetical protein